jgi:hypothetical protein
MPGLQVSKHGFHGGVVADVARPEQTEEPDAGSFDRV